MQALQHSKVLVCLYSDAYFESVYCGKEWHVFHKRRDLHVRRLQAIGQQSIDMPPIIKPIRWLPFTRNLADPVGKVHYDYGEHNGVYNTQGLRSIIKLKDSQHKDFYVKFIEDLANEILTSGEQTPVPPLAIWPTLKEIESIFHVPNNLAGRQGFIPPVTNTRRGPRNVLFVFVAAKPHELGARSVDPYLQDGGADWKPFYPSNVPIDALVLNVASDTELRLFSNEIPFNDQLLEDIKNAKKESKIVVMLVDSWTASLPTYQRVLQEFDDEFLYNCSVIVPWNDNDSDSVQKREDLERTIKNTFYVRTTINKNPIFFRDDIRSEAELRSALREILMGIRAVIRDRAPLRRPMAEGRPLPEVQNQLNAGGVV